jgi:hypothetical protein
MKPTVEVTETNFEREIQPDTDLTLIDPSPANKEEK